ncbi:hypothetical protein J1N35_030216 [Gossypium stocksii]|uniref:Methyltransferase type 11 domain-containing protein n=1 Tax=Gossypium stocksii TaxID=47602 RepID=A0A9D3ZUI7_9ROSI|nr:hypothetical protein J1N35_030216 [Gossypium stocksii]
MLTVEVVCFPENLPNQLHILVLLHLIFLKTCFGNRFIFLLVPKADRYFIGICSNIALVRADVSRLPFSSGSIDAVHGGAALHCWPCHSNAISMINFKSRRLSYKIPLSLGQHLSELKKPSYMATCFYYLQIAEISRILRSGGVFIGTTFLRYTSSTPWIIRPFRERVMQSYNYLIEEEIEELRLNPNTHSTAVSNLTATVSNLTATVINLTATAVFNLTGGKHTAHPN